MLESLTLTFHGVGTPPKGIPETELPYWIDLDAFRRVLDQVCEMQVVDVMVTFDDGNRSDIEIAARELNDRGLPGLFFPCSGRIGRPGYLDAADLKALVAQGFEIGSHGIAHVPWKGLSTTDLEAEVAQSQMAISAACGRPVTAAALPFGAYDRRALAALRRAEYAAVYSSDPGMSRAGTWFRRRWSWVASRDFDIATIVRTSRHPRHRMVSGLKHWVKALR